MTGFLLTLCVVLAALLLISIVNAVFVEELRDQSAGVCGPRVSLLVPMRNEAHNVEGALRGFLKQTYENLEIVVLDDESSDATSSLLAGVCAGADGRMRVLRGAPRPFGWVGKNFACHQLARVATGQILVFADADVRAEPEAVARTVAYLESSGAGLMSVFPQQITHTLAEKLSVPLVLLILYAFVPIPLLGWLKSPSLCPACGQWLVVRIGTYSALGGHAQVRGEVLEDIELARRARHLGERAVVLSGLDQLRTRMYRSHREVFEGFSKNAFAAARFNYLNFSVFLVVFSTLFLVPVALLPDPLAVASLALILAIKFVLVIRFRLDWFASLVLHPVSILYGIAIALNSMRWRMFGLGHWKGRPVSP